MLLQQLIMTGSFGVLIKYTGSLLPLVLGPPAIIYTLLRVSSASLPWFATIPLYLASIPLALALRFQWKMWCDERNANRLGAVLPPKVFDANVAGGNILKRMVENFRYGYLGTLSCIARMSNDHVQRFTVVRGTPARMVRRIW